MATRYTSAGEVFAGDCWLAASVPDVPPTVTSVRLARVWAAVHCRVECSLAITRSAVYCLVSPLGCVLLDGRDGHTSSPRWTRRFTRTPRISWSRGPVLEAAAVVHDGPTPNTRSDDHTRVGHRADRSRPPTRRRRGARETGADTWEPPSVSSARARGAPIPARTWGRRRAASVPTPTSGCARLADGGDTSEACPFARQNRFRKFFWNRCTRGSMSPFHGDHCVAVDVKYSLSQLYDHNVSGSPVSSVTPLLLRTSTLFLVNHMFLRFVNSFTYYVKVYKFKSNCSSILIVK